MPALAAIVLTAKHQEALASGCAQLVEQRIASRGGLRGVAMKASLSLLKAAKPDFLARAMRLLLPEFVEALDPLYQEFAKGNAGGRGDFGTFLRGHSAAAVAALLGVADARAARLQNPVVKSAYARLRGGAEDEVAAALPDFAALLARHLTAAG